MKKNRAFLPVSFAEFSQIMEKLKAEPCRIAVAVSGGPDSMALTFCAKRWADKRGCKLFAFIVDHKLRPESSAEAKMVKKRLAAIGVRAEILKWEHSPIISRVHDKARKARYDLLLRACKKLGIHDLLLAHHRDDQAETILMRFAKGSGIDGLAGMAETSVMKNIRLLRPFLSMPKERLIETCKSAKLAYVVDPSNETKKYARGRLRRVLPLLAEEGLTVDRLVDLGERAREAKEALDYATKSLLRVAVKTDVAGVISVNLEQLRSSPRAIALRALAACLQSVHATDYAPERAVLLPLLDDLCRESPMRTRTLQGCLISKGRVTAEIIREFSSITDKKPIKPGETIIWDERWEVRLSPKCKKGNFTVSALGSLTHKETDRLLPGLRRVVPKGRVRAVLPALWHGKKLSLVPDLNGFPDSLATARVVITPEMTIKNL